MSTKGANLCVCGHVRNKHMDDVCLRCDCDEFVRKPAFSEATLNTRQRHQVSKKIRGHKGRD